MAGVDIWTLCSRPATPPRVGRESRIRLGGIEPDKADLPSSRESNSRQGSWGQMDWSTVFENQNGIQIGSRIRLALFLMTLRLITFLKRIGHC